MKGVSLRQHYLQACEFTLCSPLAACCLCSIVDRNMENALNVQLVDNCSNKSCICNLISQYLLFTLPATTSVSMEFCFVFHCNLNAFALFSVLFLHFYRFVCIYMGVCMYYLYVIACNYGCRNVAMICHT